MSKYEIMVLFSGKLNVNEAEKILNELNKNIKSDNLEVKFLYTKELAYPIHNEILAHYYQLNFDGEGDSFADWKRLVLINKSILRHLIINLSKDYGWRASNNSKKVKISIAQKKKYDEIINNPDYVHPKPGPQIIARKKKRDEWTLVSRVGANGPEDITIKNIKSKKNKFSELPEYKIVSKKHQYKTEESASAHSNSKHEKVNFSKEEVAKNLENNFVEEKVIEPSTLPVKQEDKTEVLKTLVNDVSKKESIIDSSHLEVEKPITIEENIDHSNHSKVEEPTFVEEKNDLSNHLKTEEHITEDQPVSTLNVEDTKKTKTIEKVDPVKKEKNQKEKDQVQLFKVGTKVESKKNDQEKIDTKQPTKKKVDLQEKTKKPSLIKKILKPKVKTTSEKTHETSKVKHKAHPHLIENIKDKELLDLHKEKTKQKTKVNSSLAKEKKVTSKSSAKMESDKKRTLKPLLTKTKSKVAQTKKTSTKKSGK